MNLADRIEAADGPSRELDFLIAEAVLGNEEHYAGCRERQKRPWDFYEAGDPNWPTKKWEWGQPNYTASLDAAMMLVADWSWIIIRYTIIQAVSEIGVRGLDPIKDLPRFIAAAAIRAQETSK